MKKTNLERYIDSALKKDPTLKARLDKWSKIIDQEIEEYKMKHSKKCNPKNKRVIFRPARIEICGDCKKVIYSEKV